MSAKLVKALALSEASFEFIDEESMEFGSQIKNIITGVTDQIAQLRKSFAQQKQIREGVRIALIGSVNAGKSSLFNTLIGSDRAIVTNQAGTTRDVIEAGLYKDGLYWTLIDTAGLRQTKDTIEAAGIERSYKEAQKADIVLLVIDGTAQLRTAEKAVYRNLLEQYESKIITIQSKSDMPGINQNLTTDYLKVSAYQPESISKLDHMLKAKVSKLFAQDGSAHLLTTRQHSLLLALDQKLGTILPLLEGLIEYELVSHHLQEALSGLAELTGKSISEQGMDTVFREFCVGK